MSKIYVLKEDLVIPKGARVHSYDERSFSESRVATEPFGMVDAIVSIIIDEDVLAEMGDRFEEVKE